MFHVYTIEFFKKLSEFIKKGSYISCYIPESTVRSQKNILENLPKTMCNEKLFKFIHQNDEFIYVFQKC
jgi:hypothetical protein